MTVMSTVTRTTATGIYHNFYPGEASIAMGPANENAPQSVYN